MEEVALNSKPPLDIEQALDVILAAAAHRSENQKHSEFGQLFINEYLVKLREEYQNDAHAKKYLDNLFAAIASAIRAFSVERDIFGTRWTSLKEQKQYELDRANRLDQYLPFKEKGYWGKIIGVIGGMGLGGVIGEIFSQFIKESTIIVIAFVALGIVAGLMLFEAVLNAYRERRLKKISQRFPEELEGDWRSKTLQSYRLILRQFLLLAIKIREEYYPNLPTIEGHRVFEEYEIPHIQFSEKPPVNLNPELDGLYAKLDKIVEKHFAFR